MSYQVLARKWRPKNFEQLVGQEHVLGALVNALENQRLHHAYLFSGTRGVGKTTIARILARSLNCETGITAKPCGECGACTEINEGRFVDLIEVDAASRTKVEDTRDLLENVQYRPTRGRFKIYLIDEVHMLSNHSFNALLKTLEEPPEHVKFLLATTDPQKLPVTVLSRCLQFNLKNLPALRISEYLEHVLGEESVPFEKSALEHLARAAAGSMRDALSLTDQAISHGGGKLADQDVAEMLGTVDRKRIFEIIDAISKQDGEGLLKQCQELAQYSVDYLALLEEMLALLHAVAVQQAVPGAESLSFAGSEKVVEFSEVFSPEDVQLSYQMLLMGRKDLNASPDMHLGFEMLMLRLLAFQPESRTPVVKRPESSEVTSSVEPAEVAPAKKPEAAALKQPQTSQHAEGASIPGETISQEPSIEPEIKPHIDASKSKDTAQSIATIERTDQPNDDSPSLGTVGDKAKADTASPKTDITSSSDKSSLPEPPTELADSASAVAEKEVIENQSSVTTERQDAPKTLEALDADSWIPLYRELPLDGVVKSVVGHMVFDHQQSGSVTFRLADSGQPLFNQNHKQRLADCLSLHFGQPLEVSVELGGVDRETPAENARRLHREALAAAEKDMLGNPLVGELMREFQAELVPDSVVFYEEKS